MVTPRSPSRLAAACACSLANFAGSMMGGGGGDVYDEKLRTRFTHKYVYTNDPILSGVSR